MKIILACPAYGERVHAGLVRAGTVMATSLARAGIGFGWTYVDAALLDRARNRLVTIGLREGYDWIIMVDADTVPVSVDEVLTMIRDAGQLGAVVAAAPVQQRRRDGLNVRVAVDPCDPRSECKPHPEAGKPSVYAVDRVGTALMAINLRWVRDVWPVGPWFRSEYVERGDDPRNIGEDIWFCGEARRRGAVIVADGRVRTIHYGATSEAEVVHLIAASGGERRSIDG